MKQFTVTLTPDEFTFYNELEDHGYQAVASGAQFGPDGEVMKVETTFIKGTKSLMVRWGSGEVRLFKKYSDQPNAVPVTDYNAVFFGSLAHIEGYFEGLPFMNSPRSN